MHSDVLSDRGCALLGWRRDVEIRVNRYCHVLGHVPDHRFSTTTQTDTLRFMGCPSRISPCDDYYRPSDLGRDEKITWTLVSSQQAEEFHGDSKTTST